MQIKPTHRFLVALVATGCLNKAGKDQCETQSDCLAGYTCDTTEKVCKPEFGGGQPVYLERDCVRTIDAASLWFGPTTILTTEACSALGEVDLYDDESGSFSNVAGTSSMGYRYRRTIVADIGGGPSQTVGQVDHAGSSTSTTLMAMTWGAHVAPVFASYARPFHDIAIGDVNRDALPDIIAVGDGAIRVRLGTGGPLPATVPASDEHDLLSGKPYAAAAVTQLGASARPDLFFVAGTPTSPSVELGIALQDPADPLAYSIAHVETDANGPILPLVVADIDGDEIPDVIGAAGHVFAWTSASGSIRYLDQGARAIVVGDVDGDGRPEPIFLDASGSSVRRVRLAADGSLTSEPLISAGGTALAVGDFDADGNADIALLEGTPGLAGTRIAVYLSARP